MNNKNKIQFVTIIYILLLLTIMYLIKNLTYETFTSQISQDKLNKIFTKKTFLTNNEINTLISNVNVERNIKKVKNNLVISAIYCNENDYIEEWLNYHLKLKEIDHIYLYSNCNDNSYNIIKKYIDNGSITWIDFTHLKKEGIGKLNRKPQYFSLIHNYNNFRKEYNYIMHIDIDEFLHINKDLLKFLDENDNIGNFKINRYDFSGDYKIIKQKSVLKSYFYREKNPSSYKSIGRVTDITTKNNSNKNNIIMDTFAENNYIASCHEFFTDKKSFIIPSDICKINHYKLKSMQEYIERLPNSSGGRNSTKEQWEKLNKKLYEIKDNEFFTNNLTNEMIEKILKLSYNQKIRMEQWNKLNNNLYKIKDIDILNFKNYEIIDNSG